MRESEKNGHTVHLLVTVENIVSLILLTVFATVGLLISTSGNALEKMLCLLPPSKLK